MKNKIYSMIGLLFLLFSSSAKCMEMDDTDKKNLNFEFENDDWSEKISNKPRKSSEQQSTKDDFLSSIEIIKPDEIKFDLEKDFIGTIPKKFNLVRKYLKNTSAYPDLNIRSLLLYGPPGTGKSSLVFAMAKETKRILIKCSATSFITKWQGSGSKSVRQLFQIAQQLNMPTILFIDEIEIGAHDRSLENNREAKTTLLTLTDELDKLVKRNNIPIFVIVTTNIETDLDPAFKRRITCTEIPLPDNITRKKMFEHWIGKRKLAMERNLIDKLVSTTEGFSGSDIHQLIDIAQLEMPENNNVLKYTYFEDEIANIKKEKQKHKNKITQQEEIKKLQYEALKHEEKIREKQEIRMAEEDELRRLQKERLQQEKERQDEEILNENLRHITNLLSGNKSNSASNRKPEEGCIIS